MTQTRNRKDDRTFTIELKSKQEVRTVSLGSDGRLLIEGSIGSFKRAGFLEDFLLEVVGSDGELRIDLATKDLERSIMRGRDQ